MSQTIIFAFNKDGNSEEYGYTKNSWRGCMAVWDIMGKRYLGIGASIFDELSIKKIWNLIDDKKVPMNERIVMGTTFDWCLVRSKEIPKVIEAFRSFEGETSLNKQADILQNIYDSGNYMAVGWHQNSISCEMWDEYNCVSGEKHWWLFDELGKDDEIHT